MNQGMVLSESAKQVGPNSIYNNFGKLRDNFPIYDEDGNVGYMYQDKKTSQVHLSYFEQGSIRKTLDYDSSANFILGAAVTGKPGELYYLLVEAGNAGDLTSTRRAKLYKSKSGINQTIRQIDLNTKVGGLDIYEFSTGCSLAYIDTGGHLTLYISRFRTKDNKGKIHQESIAAIYDSNFLQLKRIINDGKIQDHSWAVGMRTNITTDYKFRGVDIGGNKTRSINMWSIDPETFEYTKK
jgi:hypothetical protein